MPDETPEITGEDIVRLHNSNRARTSMAVTAAISDSPDDAARAMELSRSSGVDGNIIYNDLDEFEKNFKAQMDGAIVRNNPHLEAFVRSNPMVPKLINDDYGTLDSLSSKLKLLDLPMKVLRAPEAIGKMMWPDDPLVRFKEIDTTKDISTEDMHNHPLLSAIEASGQSIFQTLGAIQNTVADAVTNLTGVRDVGAMVQSAGMTGRAHDHLGPAIGEHNAKLIRDLDQASVNMWLRNDRKPPTGVLPDYDAYLLDRNAKDIDALGEVISDAQQSTLRERNADLLASYVRQHSDADVGISVEGVAALYGDKVPLPDDGILGWVPNLAEQLEAAKRSGDDIHVPLGDLAAKMEPEVFKALADDIRVRPDGITKREADLTKEAVQPPPIRLPEAVPATRAAYGLEPLLSVGDRAIKMEKREAISQDTADFRGGAIPADQWRLLDEQGNKIGHLELTPAGKDLMVDMVMGLNGLGPRDFGPALMRSLLRQIKENYPEAERVGGYRISGAREKAGTEGVAWIKVDKLDNVDYNQFREVLEGGQWEAYSDKIKAYVKPDFARAEEDRQLVDIVGQELDRIVPKKVAVEGVESIRAKGVEGQWAGEALGGIGGAYIRYRDAYPIILYAVDSENALSAARHEAIHQLRSYGFFKEGEWETLEAQALAGGWLSKYSIDRRYPDANPSLNLEESIAEAYQDWANGAKAPTPEVHGLFERMKAFFTAIKDQISALLGKDATWEDIFQKVDTGEVGAREGKPLDPRAFDEKLSVPEEPSRVFERANALGMSVERFKAYDKNMQERHAADVESATKRISQAQARTQTKQWKADRAEMRAQVAEDINLRPDIAADNYSADGILYGNKVERVKLGTDFLTEAQRAALPRDYYNKAGAAPDDLAGLFGFPDGATLISHLSGLSEIRRQSGMRPIEFKRRVIDIETDRQMRQKYGVLDENIMDAVKEQVASETQLNMLHEETLYYGMQAKQVPLDQATIKARVAEEFETYPVSAVNSDAFLRITKRAGDALEMSLLKKDPEGAFRAKQQQYYSTLLAKHAIEFEMQVEKFEKLAGRLSKREVKAVDPAALDFIHGLLADAGIPVKRSLDEILASKGYYGKETGESTLPKYVEARAREGWDPAVSEAIQDGQVKQLDAMNVAEMRDFMDAITSLNHIGRKVRNIEIAGEKKDWQEFRQGVIDNIRMLPLRTDASLGKEGKGRYIYAFDAQLTRMEELVKDLDLRKELGPLYQAVIVPMMHSKAFDFDLKTDLAQHFRDVRGSFDHKWRKSLNDTINQDIIVDPRTGLVGERAPYDMTRETLIQVMLNWGSRSNIGKYVQGAAMAKFGRRLTKDEFPLYEAQIKGLIDKHATAADWDFVKQMWKPFEGWREKMDDVSRSTSGVVPKMVERAAFDTPHGTIEGGYWPVHYDRIRSDIGVIEDRRPTDDGVFGNNYFRAATAKGHLKERTGYVDFVDISTSLEQAAGTMQQTMHDIAYRDALIQAGRVFYDKGIRAAIRNHYGPEYEAQLVPWLRRVANQYSEDPSTGAMNDALRRTRINLVGHVLPLNLKVILSPDIGVPDPVACASPVSNRNANLKFAMEKSDEIRHLVFNMDP